MDDDEERELPDWIGVPFVALIVMARVLHVQFGVGALVAFALLVKSVTKEATAWRAGS